MARPEKVSSLIQKELALLITKEIELPKGHLITISDVEISKDVRHARVYISVMPKTGEENILQVLNDSIYELQQQLNKKLVMRHVPKIRFVIDHREERAARIEDIITSEHERNGTE